MFEQCSDLRIMDCEVTRLGPQRHPRSTASQGAVSGTTVTKTRRRRDLLARCARADDPEQHRARRRQRRHPGASLEPRATTARWCIDNRIEDIDNVAGGSGQYGNAINVFRAGNVIVRGNRISRAAFSAVRGNAASNIQITGNTATDLGEVAIYSEFGFEGAVIANNTVDGAALGICDCNFNEGGRLAVVQGNMIRNLKPKRPIGTAPDDAGGVGIAVEADASVTGNVIENAPVAGIMVGWGAYMRDVSVAGNVVRDAPLRHRRLGRRTAPAPR